MLARMARRPRSEHPGGIVHVTSRGVDRRSIFEDDRDRESFLSLLSLAIVRFHWRVYAYCLMTNHFHLLVETPQPTLAVGMKLLNGSYAQAYNRRHKRGGHLFERRYHSAPVERDVHLLEACRYVVLNPHRAFLADGPDGWRWSSYEATAAGSLSSFVAVHDVLRLFDALDVTRAMRRYRAFVADGCRAAA